MLVSERYKFIFKHVPRVAGKSIKKALRDYADYYKGGHVDFKIIKDSVEKGLIFRRIVKLDKNASIVLRHGPSDVRGQELESYRIGNNNSVDDYFKFAFVRNPFSRILSWHGHIMTRPDHKQHKKAKSGTFEEWIEWLYKNHDERSTQVGMLADEERDLIPDFIGRFEALEDDFRKVCERIGIGEIALPNLDFPNPGFVNQSKNRNDFGDYRKYYSEKAVKLMNEMYAVDLNVFGYEFGG